MSTRWDRSTAALLTLSSLLAVTSRAQAWNKNGTTYTTDGSQADVVDAANHASPGDLVLIPAGTFTWGADAASAASYFPVAVTLQGAGPDKTTIKIGDAGPTYTTGIINLYAPVVVRDFTVTQGGNGNTTAFSTGASGVNDSTGWRITNVVYNSAATAGYFAYAGTYGLIDGCTLNAGSGSDELIFSRGPADSWQTASSMGTADAVYIEDCTFNSDGYVSDFNSNARGVVRFSTINGAMKVDAHGVASNTPPRGVRQMEVYGNRWTQTTGYFAAIELRGGTGRVFDNVGANAQGDWFFLTDYGYLGQWPNFGNVFQTPNDYPIADQIGVGKDPKTAASEPYYVWSNVLAGAPWKRTVKTPADGATALYDQQANTDAGFAETDIVQADRDFFWQGDTFDGSSGVGRGTAAQMKAIKPTKSGVGFWVTDESSWNKTLPANKSGQLYVWDGAAWVLAYTPYTYPHPLRHLTTELDGGAGGAGSGGGAAGTGGSGGSGGSAGANGGCGCSTAPTSSTPAAGLALLLVLLSRRRAARSRGGRPSAL
jgi:MYXO-CTERM domain-containing protein